MRETKSIQIAGTREKGKESETHARALVGLRLLLKVALEVEGEVVVVGHRGERERERKTERKKESACIDGLHLLYRNFVVVQHGKKRQN